ncbi:MAG: PEP/pyruvate-binding domain-containing protein [Planctomycetota bacterium]
MARQETDSIYPPFDRKFLASDQDFTVIGGGEVGGKAKGLAFIKSVIADSCPADAFSDVEISIPTLTVLTTDVFERFMDQNDLYDIAISDAPDDRIAHAFQKAELPPLIVGDLRALIAQMHTPLAIRSSSLLEDALSHPFAGTYATKMIPNNEAGVDKRFHKLVEAIKFVLASTFFRDAKSYMRAIGRKSEQERMAVIIQEVVGQRLGDRFYPTISGVIRTYNFYPTKPARPEHGVVNLALGLGKTIVDGGVSWTYAPAFPRHSPPFGSVRDQVKNTQAKFWVVNMGSPPAYDPIAETEYLRSCSLDDAEADDVLRYIASTYDSASDRLVIGTGHPGPRVLTFAPILDIQDVPLNKIVKKLSAICKDAVGSDVEIEFAMTLDRQHGLPARFGFLQLRPMLVSEELVEVKEQDLECDRALVASDTVLGNGALNTIEDVVYVRPEAFEAKHTPTIAAALEHMNNALVAAGRPYLLMGFGRWGSSDPWLGIPVTWPQISGARVIVEATLPEMNVDPSQGSHFFHNISSFRIHYLTVSHASPRQIDWVWLGGLPAIEETEYVRHVRTPNPLDIKVDGRAGRGVILRD